jgi:hypothetical protein
MKGRIPGFSYDPKKHLAHFSLYVPKTNGKLRRERTVHANSREEAIRLWQAFRDEISGKPVAADPPAQPRAITFAAFVTEYLEKICARRAKKTLAIYRTIAFTRLIPYFGEKPLDSIRSCDVEDFMAAMLGDCSPAYVNNCARTMKALMNHAVKRQIIATSPSTEKIRFEEVPLPELELTDEERLAFIGAFDDESGFKQDVAKLERRIVSRYVFVNHDGTRVGDITLRRAFLRAKRIAGVTRRFRFHDLRHTAACTLASAGVSLQVIQKILGHTSSRMTERYVRVNDAAVAEARRALDIRNSKFASQQVSATNAEARVRGRRWNFRGVLAPPRITSTPGSPRLSSAATRTPARSSCAGARRRCRSARAGAASS